MERLRRHVGRSHLIGNGSRVERQLNKLLTWICMLSFVSSCALGLPDVHAVKPFEAENSVRQSPIRLVLQTSKEVYRVGEPVKTTVFLENISPDSSYYVGRYIDGVVITPPFHDIEFTLIDDKGKQVLLPRGAADDNPTRVYGVDGRPMPLPRQTIIEKLTGAYVQLDPRAIHGFRREIDEPTLRPSRYRLHATYRETEALRWTEAERKALSIPVWTQPLVSNTVTITVVPSSPPR